MTDQNLKLVINEDLKSQLRSLSEKVPTTAVDVAAPLKAVRAKKDKRVRASAKETLFDFDRLPDSALVDIPAVAALHSISVATAWRWINDGLLPPLVRFGTTSRFRVGDLRENIRHADSYPGNDRSKR